MSEERYKILTYWRNRQESAEACAVRAARMIEALSTLHPIYARWDRAGSHGKPLCSMPPHIDELTMAFMRGRHFKEVPREVWPELGFTVYAVNGRRDDGFLVLKIDAGLYDDWRPFPNHVFLEDEGLSTLDIPTLKASLLAIAAAWDVDWAYVTTSADTRRLLERSENLPSICSGWMVYLDAPLAAKVAPPPEAIVECLPGGALLMLATEAWFTVENPAHLAASEAIQAALAPIQPPERKFGR